MLAVLLCLLSSTRRSAAAFSVTNGSRRTTTATATPRTAVARAAAAAAGAGAQPETPPTESLSTALHDNETLLEVSKPKRPLTTTTTKATTTVVIGPQQVLIYDTSLRDGTQGESVSASVNDKLKICRRLAAFGVDYIEAGWPGSNPKDAEFFQRAATELSTTERAKLAAFGSTRRKGIAAADDAQVRSLVDSGASTVCIVAKSHPWQVTDILRATLTENVDMIRDTVAHLAGSGRQVMVDLEHFFDGYQSDPDYALECAEAAVDAGAVCIVLCDTNGGTMPWQAAAISKSVVQHFAGKCTIGIHCHNDCNMAVANSVSAANAGVGLIQGTVNGIGERTGNADLCSIVPSLAFHVGSNMTCCEQLPDLTSLSRFVDEVLNRTPNQAAPFVGTSAFAHKGGLHVAAMERSPLSYQHVDPETVGNEKRILISELSGRQNILGKMEEVGGVDRDGKPASERALAILNRVKQLENVGYTFEGAEASVHLMILHSTKGYCPPFQVMDYSAHVYDSNLDSASRVMQDCSSEHAISTRRPTARATIQIRTIRPDDESEFGAVLSQEDTSPYVDRLEVSDGNGPIDALAKALKRSLLPSYPSLEDVELADYKVRILDPESATGAATRVMIEFRDAAEDTTWTTVSVDTNVISASLNALIDGFEFALIEQGQLCLLGDDAY